VSAALRNRTLRRRVTLIIVAVAVVLFGAIGVAVVVLERTQQAQQNVVQDYFVAIQGTNTQFVEYLDAGAAVQNYLLTGDRAVLEPFELVRSSPPSDLQPQVEAMYGAGSEPARQLRAAHEAAQQWIDEWALPSIAQVDEQGTAAIDTTEAERGRVQFDAVREAYAEFLNALLAGRSEAESALQLRTTLLFATVAVLALLAAFVAAALWYLIRKWVIAPIDELAAETRVVSQGDLQHSVASTGPPEFVLLADDVETMRGRLVDQIAVIETSNREISAAREQLEIRTEELQRSNRDLEQFAYVASHDLQEPLRKIASFCQMLQRRYRGQLDERADQYIDFAVDGATRMQRLINDLLTFSRVGRAGIPEEDVDLDQCVRQVIDNLSTVLEETGAQLTCDDLPTVQGDGTLLTQLLQNLVGNALKFRGNDPPTVHVGAKPTDDGWEFWCTDNGIGIDPEYAQRVFVIFQRLHPKEEYGGTGIGLAVCKKIVEHHGGEIWVDTAADTGTTIRWTLPAKVPAQRGTSE
jgi:signal transduction histidine kinase